MENSRAYVFERQMTRLKRFGGEGGSAEGGQARRKSGRRRRRRHDQTTLRSTRRSHSWNWWDRELPNPRRRHSAYSPTATAFPILFLQPDLLRTAFSWLLIAAAVATAPIALGSNRLKWKRRRRCRISCFSFLGQSTRCEPFEFRITAAPPRRCFYYCYAENARKVAL